ncbi:MAG TPA: tryptophan 7-halogenase [Povalibacter sp.]|uniref:tryptophan halogenase family protein n=1 Tax=Povalibacter sp. TaxID=1962978 RepID=UPI002C2E997B|nr:tryptophan halogenase family protein [Povalibacter sp.]HMN47296.1 tryptophan 7-halogenase [Povalibacter sp.]
MNQEVRSVVIAGGGTAGWMAAAALARVLGPRLQITLVESSEIGIVGVGEATIPAIAQFNRMLCIDEDDFLRSTHGTYKLGIEFVDWYEKGHAYMHAFGPVGRDLAYVPFHHYWLRDQAGALWDYSLNHQAAKQARFARLERVPDTPLAGLTWAFHFDASLYAAYLSRLAQHSGVRQIDGVIADVRLDPESGDVHALRLTDGRELAADFFIDCTGFRALLIGKALGTEYEDWSQWLPCDRAWAVPSRRVDPLLPYTRATAREAGWQWRIPLQHRTGNGHVYSSAHMSDERARETLLANLESEPLAEPRLIRFTTGRRRQLWNRNVVCLGLASGFVEPLESTAIHLIQVAIQRLILLFPHRGDVEERRREFNRAAAAEYEYIRDFIVLHYHANNRRGEPLWDACRNLSIPDSLRHRIELFRETAGIFCATDDLFQLTSWLQVLWGQGVRPRETHPFVSTVAPGDRQTYLQDLRRLIDHAARQLPGHADFIARHCAAAT